MNQMKNTNPSIMTGLRRTTARNLLGFLGLAVLIFGQAATATAQVTITEVHVDLPLPNQVTINGSDFGNSQNQVVTLGNFPQLNIVPPLVPMPNQIIADLPAGMPVGDFLLTVTTGNGPNRQDTYDLTIGAAGPAGVVPMGGIILWDQSNACPAGFAQVAAFNGMFLVGGNVAGDVGGETNHAHGAGNLTGPAHTHNHVAWDDSPNPVDDNSGGTNYNNATGPAVGGAVGGTTALANNLPPFRTILLCRLT
jgi:hypothetical protein